MDRLRKWYRIKPARSRCAHATKGFRSGVDFIRVACGYDAADGGDTPEATATAPACGRCARVLRWAGTPFPSAVYGRRDVVMTAPAPGEGGPANP